MVCSDYARKADQSNNAILSGFYKNKLDEYLKLNDFSVSQTYRTAVIKTYVQGLGVGNWSQDKKLLNYFFETEDANLSSYINILLDEIQTIKPRVIIALGEYALRTLTGKEGIGKWRGSVLPLANDLVVRLNDIHWEIKVIPTYHPNVTHTEEHLQYIIRSDFKKAVDLVFQPNKRIDYHEIHIARNSGEVIRFNEMYPIEKFPKMTIDIETHFGFITCAGYSFDGYRGMTIPMTGSRLDIVEKARMQYMLSQLIYERDLVNQNITYDKRISQRFGFRFRKVTWDTMLAAHTLMPEFPKRLDFLTSIYTDMSFYKDEGREYDPRTDSIDQLYGYNCKDAITTFQIYEKQKIDLEKFGMLEFFEDFIMRLFDLYYDIDSTGMLIDLDKRSELLAKYEGLYNLKRSEVDAITALGNVPTLNIKSSAQIGKFMEAFDFPVLRHRVDSGYMVVNTDVDSLKKMRIADPVEWRHCKIGYEHGLRFINLILLLRRIDKVIEYLNVGIHPWNRVHTGYRLSVTTSGRSSAGQTSDGFPYWDKDKKGRKVLEWKQLGQSFQTVTKHGFIVEGEEDTDIEEGVIGKDIRDMYITDPDMVFVEVDGSQAEARVCDVLGEDWASLAEYGKVDKHCKVAAEIFTDYSYEEIFKLAKKLKTDEGVFMRQIGKHSKHAKNNGMEAFLFAQKYIPISDFRSALAKAKVILARIDRAYPNIEKVFHAQVEHHLRTTRQLIAPKPFGLPCGRKRLFFKKIDKHYLNVAYSYLPQAAISDHTKAAALRIMDRVDKTKVWLVAENHDSITTLVRRGYLRKYCSIAKQELERPIDFRECTLNRDIELVIPAEFSISRTRWGQLREVKKLKLINILEAA